MTNRLSDLTPEAKQALLRNMLKKRLGGAASAESNSANGTAVPVSPEAEIPESFYRPEKFPHFIQLQLQRAVVDRAGIANPFFLLHEGIARDTTRIDGREVVNFSTYNYLDLNGHPEVSKAAQDAIARYGTSASASRVVSGERPPHRSLERALAELHGVDDTIVFVSGHATNVSVISTIMGPKDLILHDRLAHNSIVVGAELSQATRQSVPHNDMTALETVLATSRNQYEKVLIAVEGIYGMDGDAAPLAALVALKRKYKALLMIDEAHSIGALGATGRGAAEHAGIQGRDVDLWMGTLSKTLAGCGGYIAGSAALIDLLKLTAPGFVYSVGMPPGMAAASETALRLMLREPERVQKLHRNAALFLELARAKGLDTGTAEGYNIIPVITGRSTVAAKLSNALLGRGINVAPIIYPAVEERAARLRFFISCAHTEAQLRDTVHAVAEELKRVNETISI